MTANPDEYYKNPELLPPGGYAPLAMKGFNRKAPQINVINSEYSGISEICQQLGLPRLVD